MDLYEAHLLAPGVQGVHGLLHAAADGAHGHHHAVGVGRAIVVEAVVLPAGDLADLRHIVLHDVGEGGVVGVAGLAHLEVDVRVLHRGADHGVLGVQRPGAEGVERVIVDQAAQGLVVHLLDLVDLVGGPEAVEEVHEGHPALDGRQVRNAREVHDLLHAAGGQHRKAGIAAAHDVRVVAEYGHGVGAHGTGRHMQHAGQPLARDAVKHRDHEHEPLRRGEARRQRAGLQRAVHRRRRAGLGLHLDELHRLAEQVLFALGRPHVGLARHGRGRRDGIDGGDLGEGVGHVGRCLVAVHGDVDGIILLGHGETSFIDLTGLRPDGRVECGEWRYRMPGNDAAWFRRGDAPSPAGNGRTTSSVSPSGCHLPLKGKAFGVVSFSLPLQGKVAREA